MQDDASLMWDDTLPILIDTVNARTVRVEVYRLEPSIPRVVVKYEPLSTSTNIFDQFIETISSYIREECVDIRPRFPSELTVIPTPLPLPPSQIERLTIKRCGARRSRKPRRRRTRVWERA